MITFLKIAINALHDVDYIVDQFSFLIENPNEIIAIGKRAKAFIEKKHDYEKISDKFISAWH